MSTTFPVTGVPSCAPRVRPLYSPEDYFENQLAGIKVKKGTVEAYDYNTDNKVEFVNPAMNAFVHCCVSAFNYHTPLVFSPDDIWMVVLQAFSTYIGNNVEEARKALVGFDGKKQIHIYNNDFVKGGSNNPWAREFQKFSDGIEEYLGKKRDLFDQTFSTTTEIEKVAIQVQMMSALSPYFDYIMHTRCGLPSVTLLGTVEDWNKIVVAVEAAAEFYPAWAHLPMLTAVQNFQQAAAGKPNRDFWQSFVKSKSQSGGTPVTGWINAFFPYVDNGNKNRMFEGDFAAKFSKEPGYGSGNDAGDFPGSTGSVPMLWDYMGTNINMRLVTGIMGYTEYEGGYRPVIGWAVGEESKEG